MLQIKVMYQKEGNSAEVVRNVAEEELQFVLGKMIYNVSARKPMVFRPWDEWCLS